MPEFKRHYYIYDECVNRDLRKNEKRVKNKELSKSKTKGTTY